MSTDRGSANALVRALLEDHQRMHPHHSRLCALCIESRQFLGLEPEFELCSDCANLGPIHLGEIAASSHGCFRCGKYVAQ